MRRAIVVLLCCSVPWIAGGAPPSSEPPPLDWFLAAPVYRSPKLSPDGRSYSVIVTRDDVEALTVVDLATGKATPVSKSTEMEFVGYWWKGDDRLLVLLQDWAGRREFQVVDVKTQTADIPRALRNSFVQLVSPLPDDPDNVLLSTGEGTGVDLEKFNLRTGQAVSARLNAAYMVRWLVDQRGEPVAGLGVFHKRWFAIVPAGPGQPWRRVELGERNPPDFLPAILARDQRHVLGFQRGTADTITVVSWDPVTDAKETVWQSREVDPDYLSIWGEDWSRTKMVTYETDHVEARCFDDDDQAVVRMLGAALPGTTNTISSATPDQKRMIIERIGDRMPDDIYLLDRPAKRLAKLGSAYAHVEPTRLAASRYFTCPARDGLTLHGRIYLPPGVPGGAPAVLWVGALTERSRFGYAPYFQLFATHGFAVIAIDHRGVDGYGEKFTRAGNRAVAGAMGDDLIDGLDWLGRQGWIDPRRVAILGENRGGLLALPTLARYPDRFAAWVNFWTPMDMDDLDTDEMVFGCFSDAEIKQQFGGETERRRYQRSLDPLGVVPRIKQPSFNYYPCRRGFSDLLNAGDRLASYYAKAGMPAVFVKGTAGRSDQGNFRQRVLEIREERRRVFTELLQFLGHYVAAKP